MLLPFSGTYYYFSKGLSSKESETSLVASRIEGCQDSHRASQIGPREMLICGALLTIPMCNLGKSYVISLRLLITLYKVENITPTLKMRKLRTEDIYASWPHQPGNSQTLVFRLHVHFILLYSSLPKEGMEQVLNGQQQMLIEHTGFLIKCS